MRHQIIAAAAAAVLLAACNDQTGDGGDLVVENRSTTSSVGQGRSASATGSKQIAFPGSSATPAGFWTSKSIEPVIAWYRDPARREEMMFASTERLDDGYLVMGTAGEEGDPFALKLTARSDGGTEGRSIPYDPKVGLNRDLLKSP